MTPFRITNVESGIVTSYAYDIMDRATNISYRTSTGSLIRSLDYAYDALGMITNKVAVGPVPSPGVSTSYEYDTINRLIREDSGNLWAEYSYDLAGNRLVRRSLGEGGTNTYALGVGNRLASWGENGSASYDVAGNTTNLVSSDGRELNLQWDERYRLTSVEGLSNSSQPSVSYTYDVLGRRVSRSVAGGGDPGSTNVEHYIYSGNQVAADLDASGNILRTYTWGPGIDNLLSLTAYGSDASNPITYYALKDHQNSVLALTDASGNIVESYEYDAYGRTTIFDSTGNPLTSDLGLPTSAVGNRYLWQGREYDSTTGLTYFRARWYSSETGRWLSKDPIGISGGLNLYAFCGNNPVNFVDPTGLKKETPSEKNERERIARLERADLRKAQRALEKGDIDEAKNRMKKHPHWESLKTFAMSLTLSMVADSIVTTAASSSIWGKVAGIAVAGYAWALSECPGEAAPEGSYLRYGVGAGQGYIPDL